MKHIHIASIKTNSWKTTHHYANYIILLGEEQKDINELITGFQLKKVRTFSELKNLNEGIKKVKELIYNDLEKHNAEDIWKGLIITIESRLAKKGESPEMLLALSTSDENYAERVINNAYLRFIKSETFEQQFRQKNTTKQPFLSKIFASFTSLF